MIGEFALIDLLAGHLTPEGGRVVVGHGDDAAVLDLRGEHAVLAVDTLVEGRHWLRELSRPEDVGWKAVTVNCSDLAAMGADPVAAVIALNRPAHVPTADLEAMYRGMAEAGKAYGVALVGGDTVASEVLSVSVTVLGSVAPGAAVRRSGARVGDVLLCVGPLGRAAAGLAEALSSGEPVGGHAAPDLLTAHRRPVALLAAGRVLADEGARAMIDVSDGLGADVGHLCRASGVSARLREADLPVDTAVRAAAERLARDPVDLACGGEDLALVAAIPPERAERALRHACEADEVPGAIIGTVEQRGDVLVALETSEGMRDLSTFGYDHYEGQHR